MHVLLTNDDGPPNDVYSPYVQTFANAITTQTDWDLTIAVPSEQRSWIGKAHIIGNNITASYVYTKGTEEGSKGPFPHTQKDLAKDHQEWVLLDGTPASCANIGVNHLDRSAGPVDLVISGPNYGRNTSAAYILSSGTVGASMEAALCGKKTISLSYSYKQKNHPQDHVATASRLAVKLIKHLLENWHPDVQIYTINIPLSDELSDSTKVTVAPILQNQWSAVFEPWADPVAEKDREGQTEPSREQFRWAPNFALCDETVRKAGPGSDAWAVMNGEISVTPLRAVFQGVDSALAQTIDLSKLNVTSAPAKHEAFIDTNDEYVREAWNKALAKHDIAITSTRPEDSAFIYEDYDDIDFDGRQASRNLEYSYVFRKGLIRKNYLANTIAYYRAKNPESILSTAFPDSFNLEVDYAEFLDDSLDEAYELRQEIEKGGKTWILKPAMSDRAQGIRIFRTIYGLQEIFDAFEEAAGDSEDEEKDDFDDDHGVIASHLRHFVVQEYIDNPLLVDKRKFHLRVYVLAVGAIKVYVYQDMLALFSHSLYTAPTGENVDLRGHLTNTCLQGEDVDVTTVKTLDGLDLDKEAKTKIKNGINEVVRDLFAAAVADPVNFQSLPNIIEFYGLDFLVRDDFQVSLLEVNAYPDFKQTGNDLAGLVWGLFDSTVSTAIIPFLNGSEEGDVDSRLTLVLDKHIGR